MRGLTRQTRGLHVPALLSLPEHTQAHFIVTNGAMCDCGRRPAAQTASGATADSTSSASSSSGGTPTASPTLAELRAEKVRAAQRADRGIGAWSEADKARAYE